MKTGTELIAAERQRQINKEGYTFAHDDEHDGGEMADAAACYAAVAGSFMPYKQETSYAQQIIFKDPWPWDDGDKRFSFGERRNNPGNFFSDQYPTTLRNAERIDLLTKAGALCAAEIDRLARVAP